MLSNSGLYLCAAVHYVLLFLVQAVNSNQFQILQSSYSSHPFLWALVLTHYIEVIEILTTSRLEAVTSMECYLIPIGTI